MSHFEGRCVHPGLSRASTGGSSRMQPLFGSEMLAVAHFLSRRSRKSRSRLSLVGKIEDEKDVTERDGRDMDKLASLPRVDEPARAATHLVTDSERGAARRRRHTAAL